MPKCSNVPRPFAPITPRPVGIIHQKPRVKTIREVKKFRQGSHVAIHAEHAVGHDQGLAVRRPVQEQPLQVGNVSMAIHPELGAAQATAVDQTGVAEPVSENQSP